MSTILIIGGGGFLANAIAAHYQQQGWRIVAVGRGAGSVQADVRQSWNLPHPEFARLLAAERPTLCINAAGRASVAASLAEPLADFEASTLLNFRLLDDLRRCSPETIYVHLSSAAVYGDPPSLPIREGAPIEPISPYGWHKYLSELVLQEHVRQFGLRTASLRIFSAYGAGLRRQVVWELAARALADHDGPLVLQGCSEDSRDFIHGTDVARAVQAIAESGALTGESYNVASGTETSILEVAKMVVAAAGRDRAVIFDANRRPGNPGRWHADIGQLSALGFQTEIALADGVEEVVQAARNLGAER